VSVSVAARLTVVISAACVGAAGCAGYHVGTLLPERYKTIGVPMFRNETNQPNLGSLATNAVIEQLNVDRTLAVVDNDPDLLLECTIIDYVRTPIRYKYLRTLPRDDEGSGLLRSRPIEYRLTITVSAALKDLRGKEEIWSKRQFSGDHVFAAGGDLHSSERAILPMVMEDLAHDIVEAIVEGW